MTAPSPAPALSDAAVRKLLACLAAAHMAGGAAAHEAHEDVIRAARGLGIEGVQIQASPNGITLALGHGEPATFEAVESQFRLDQTARVAAIQHGLETGRLTPDVALNALVALRKQRARFPIAGMYFGGAIVAMGISCILQPSIHSIIFSAAASPITVALIRLTQRKLIPGALLPLFAAFFVSLAAFAAFQAEFIVSPLRTMLPPLAVLLPGGLITTGLSELVVGAMVAGTARLAYGTVQLVMFSAGVLGAGLALNAPASAYSNTRANDLGAWAGFLGLLALTAGICLMESVPKKLAPGVLAITTATYLTQWGVQSGLGSPWGGALCGAFIASFAAWTVAWVRPEISRLVMFLPSFWLLVPGSLGLVSVTQLGFNPHESWSTTLTATSVIVSISLGLIFGTTTARGLRLLSQLSSRSA